MAGRGIIPTGVAPYSSVPLRTYPYRAHIERKRAAVWFGSRAVDTALYRGCAPVLPCTDDTDDTDITDTNSEPHKVVFVTGNRAARSRMHFYFAL